MSTAIAANNNVGPLITLKPVHITELPRSTNVKSNSICAVTAEMLLLFTFVLLGSSVIWTGFKVISGPTLLFAAIAVLIRTPVYLLSLLGSGVDRRGRLLIAWFGPRGLSSLLLVLLAVFAGVPDSDRLFAVCSLVVLVSVVLHGGSPMLLAG